MFGLILSDPRCDASARADATAFLHARDIPVAAFTEATGSVPVHSRAAFLRGASWALLIPGMPLPMDATLAYLADGPMPANVLRRYLFLQLSLLPYLRPGRAVTRLAGCFLLGDDLLVAPVSEEDAVDVHLPPGVWTELTGETHRGRIRRVRGYHEMPVLARENALLPIGVDDRHTDHDDADRLTLHWYQPGAEAACTLADGTVYRVRMQEGQPILTAGTDKPCHLILHRDGETVLVR